MKMMTSDLIGKQKGRLTVLYFSQARIIKGRIRTFWLCRCSCGVEKEFSRDTLTSGKTKSCGCLHREGNSATHRKTGSRVYNIYVFMKRRCYDPKNKNFADYGERGITVCPRWYESFENFYEDMGDPPDKYTIERIDNNLGYSPENCKWATRKEQGLNKRNNHYLTYKGETLTIGEWATKLGINISTLRDRLFVSKWGIEKAFETPLLKY
jgi:hypothetical protein